MPSPDRGVRGPVPAEEAGAPVQAPAAGHCLHGHLHPVRGPPPGRVCKMTLSMLGLPGLPGWLVGERSLQCPTSSDVGLNFRESASRVVPLRWGTDPWCVGGRSSRPAGTPEHGLAQAGSGWAPPPLAPEGDVVTCPPGSSSRDHGKTPSQRSSSLACVIRDLQLEGLMPAASSQNTPVPLRTGGPSSYSCLHPWQL